jgi:hypothetical protein
MNATNKSAATPKSKSVKCSCGFSALLFNRCPSNNEFVCSVSVFA